MLYLSFPTQASVSQQPGSSRVSKAGSVHKPAAPSEEKKPETAVSKLQRREQLKKSNTLPTSVTGRSVLPRLPVLGFPRQHLYFLPSCDCHSISGITGCRLAPDLGINSDADANARLPQLSVERQ